MTARERILALRLLEKQKQKPDYARQTGIQVNVLKKDSKDFEDKHV